jgi:ribosome-binding factor A
MAQDFKRTDRIADQMQRDLAELLRSSLKDPRVGMVTINQVVVAKDLGYSDIYVTLLTAEDLDADSPEVKSTIKVLNGAAGFLRSELSRMIKLRTIPQLRFHFDASVKRGRQLDRLITDARKKDENLSTDHDENGESDTVSGDEG